MYRTLASWTYTNSTAPGTRVLELRHAAAKSASEVSHYLVARSAHDEHGNRRIDAPGLALHGHRICKGSFTCELWLEAQQDALLSQGWRLAECTPFAESFTMTRKAWALGRGQPSKVDNFVQRLLRRA